MTNSYQATFTYTNYKICIHTTKISIGEKDTAKKPIVLCLELKGKDAIDFQDYMNNLDDNTPEGRKLMREAAKLAKEKRLNEL